MKSFILIILSLFSVTCISEALEEAREVTLSQVQYREPSQEGVVRIKNCPSCAHELYTFKSNLKVIKNNQPASISNLMTEYWNAKAAVLLIKPGTNELLRLAYRL